VITVAPSNIEVGGQAVFYASVLDGAGGTLSASSVVWTVADPAANNSTPTLSNPGTRQNDVGDVVVLQLNAHDNDNDPLTFSANGLPAGLVLNSSTGLISGSPTTPGRYSVVLSVTDGTSSVNQGFTWTIRTVNVAPVLTNPGDQTNQVTQFLVLALQAVLIGAITAWASRRTLFATLDDID